jgi:hypothetical protein
MRNTRGREKNNPAKEWKDGMTTEKAGQKNEREEKCAAMGCCSPQCFVKMMDKCGDGMKRECGVMMKEMGKCCPKEEK